jgi:hypothetical protein
MTVPFLSLECAMLFGIVSISFGFFWFLWRVTLGFERFYNISGTICGIISWICAWISIYILARI